MSINLASRPSDMCAGSIQPEDSRSSQDVVDRNLGGRATLASSDAPTPRSSLDCSTLHNPSINRTSQDAGPSLDGRIPGTLNQVTRLTSAGAQFLESGIEDNKTSYQVTQKEPNKHPVERNFEPVPSRLNPYAPSFAPRRDQIGEQRVVSKHQKHCKRKQSKVQDGSSFDRPREQVGLRGGTSKDKNNKKHLQERDKVLGLWWFKMQPRNEYRNEYWNEHEKIPPEHERDEKLRRTAVTFPLVASSEAWLGEKRRQGYVEYNEHLESFRSFTHCLCEAFARSSKTDDRRPRYRLPRPSLRLSMTTHPRTNRTLSLVLEKDGKIDSRPVLIRCSTVGASAREKGFVEHWKELNDAHVPLEKRLSFKDVIFKS